MEEAPELHREPEVAAEMAVNAVLNYLHSCKIENKQEKRYWIDLVFDRVKARELNR